MLRSVRSSRHRVRTARCASWPRVAIVLGGSRVSLAAFRTVLGFVGRGPDLCHDDHLEDQLVIARLNQRGVTSHDVYDGGKQERQLADG